MREDRAGFVAFFGGDELVLPPGEAEERLNAYYRHRQEAALARRPARRRPPNLPGLDVPAFEFPPGLADAGTVGIIYDEDRRAQLLSRVRDAAGPVRPAGARSRQAVADALRGYLRSETYRAAAVAAPGGRLPGHGGRGVPEDPAPADFTWTEHGEALMRRRKRGGTTSTNPVPASRSSATACWSWPPAVAGKPANAGWPEPL